MGGSRAIMTDTERERLAGAVDVDDIKIYQAKSRVRRRIREQLTHDVEVLAEHHPEMLELLRDTVETDASPDDSGSATDETTTQPDGSAVDTTDPERSDMTAPERDPRDVVIEVAQSWQKDAHFENRIGAAVEVVTHAIELGEPISKRSDIVAAVTERYPVEGHNKQEYWRQTLEPVLSEFGEYSWGADAYRVTDLSTD
jgi:hypothetical protein